MFKSSVSGSRVHQMGRTQLAYSTEALEITAIHQISGRFGERNTPRNRYSDRSINWKEILKVAFSSIPTAEGAELHWLGSSSKNYAKRWIPAQDKSVAF